ncbi:hypothetical protein ASE23_26050 [Rhizobium sp. Root73]|nr:hypothetical protein ASE23_26050 [Rhizobium sp. Root73]
MVLTSLPFVIQADFLWLPECAKFSRQDHLIQAREYPFWEDYNFHIVNDNNQSFSNIGFFDTACADLAQDDACFSARPISLSTNRGRMRALCSLWRAGLFRPVRAAAF